eukprot:Gb_35056 [translate_table: standard]
MSNHSDPRQPSTAKPYIPPSISSQDLPPDYSSFLAIMFGVAGVMLRRLTFGVTEKFNFPGFRALFQKNILPVWTTDPPNTSMQTIVRPKLALDCMRLDLGRSNFLVADQTYYEVTGEGQFPLEVILSGFHSALP